MTSKLTPDEAESIGSGYLPPSAIPKVSPAVRKYHGVTYSVTGSSADEYACIEAGLTEDDARELARQESATGRWGTVLVKLAATGLTVAEYSNGERRPV